ncbi:MAG: T9SS type A sorting domain-containing protein [Bacteroidota bacterium]|nr:T9SS type A sorting domain-containing protein [Bacteroidota bacterium]
MKAIVMKLWMLAACWIFFSSITEAPSPCDSPLVGDHSGAPGETNCSGCHSSPVNPDTPDLLFALDSNQGFYIPGRSYLVHLKINRSGHDKFGFVSTSLDSLNKAKGTFEILTPTTTRKFDSGNRKYVSHTPCGADSKDSIHWTFQWVAPLINSGTLKIYMSLLVANHDHALSGDTTYTKILTLKPSMPNKSMDLGNYSLAKVYPTLFNHFLIIEFSDQFLSKEKHCTITDITGKIVDCFSTVGQTITHSMLDHPHKGIYFIQIESTEVVQTFKLLKQ